VRTTTGEQPTPSGSLGSDRLAASTSSNQLPPHEGIHTHPAAFPATQNHLSYSGMGNVDDMPAAKRSHDGAEKEQRSSAFPSFMPMFEFFRAELDKHHDRRERVIKGSRDITALSKKMLVTPLMAFIDINVDKIGFSPCSGKMIVYSNGDLN
jgi:hypothetical protein